MPKVELLYQQILDAVRQLTPQEPHQLEGDFQASKPSLDYQSGHCGIMHPDEHVPHWVIGSILYQCRKHQMVSSRGPQLLELGAILRRLPGADIEVSDVGTVVELLPPDGLEVE